MRYDGHDLTTLDLAHLRRRIGAVLQGGKLWAGDLLANISGASSRGPEAAMDAARRAGLAADIEAMPMGLYTVVGEGLSTLSGGQRQRVMLARALLGEPAILLLDEATSALDSEIEAAIQESLYRLMEGKTVMAIAHRLSTIAAMDRLIVLDKGRIVEEGNHYSLLAQKGLYARLWAHQSGGFLGEAEESEVLSAVSGR